MAQLTYHKANPYSLRLPIAITSTAMLPFRTASACGGAEIDFDFNLYLVHPSGKVDIRLLTASLRFLSTQRKNYDRSERTCRKLISTPRHCR